MIKKYLKVFVIFFLIYFVLGVVFTHYMGTYKYWNVIYDMDIPRAVGDITLINFNHYRIAVHPLMIIFLQPLFLLINIIFSNTSLSLVFIQSVFSSISITCLYGILNKINKNNPKLNSILLLLFGLSFGQIIFTSFVETYIYAQTFLMLMWLYATYKIDKKLKFYDYVILTLLGVGSLAITITNFAQFLIVIFFVVFCNEKEDNKLSKSIWIIICVLAFSVFLAEIQNIIWPSAPNFFSKIITDLISNTSEEKLYLNFKISKYNFMNIFNAMFLFSFNIFNLQKPGTGIYVTFTQNNIISILSLLLFVAFVIFNVIFLYKKRGEFKKNKIYFAMIISLFFNLALHTVYGNSIAFLYICHYNFLIITTIAIISNVIKKPLKLLDNKLFIRLICLIIIFLATRSVVTLYNLMYPVYNHIENLGLTIFIIIMAAMIILSILYAKDKNKLILCILLSIVICVGSWKLVNFVNRSNDCKQNCNIIEEYRVNYNKYIQQLKEMKNEYNVLAFEDREEKLNIFYFGMADRKKMLFKEGKLIDLKNGTIIKEIEYKDFLIVPNEYVVVLIDKQGKEYKIFENEEGIFIESNGKIETIEKGEKEINLPNFDGKRYSEVLKVLHQEILFNIDGDIPKPNLFGYSTAWYRDSMLATMVLEETNNTELLRKWVDSIDSIYDYSRSKDIKETDNLGELLYIIGAVNPSRTDLIEKIQKEINALKGDGNTISGMVDGVIQTYYPTALVIFGSKKLNINTDLVVPTYDDAYAKLTWYTDKIASSIYQTSKYYPYINWAFYHYAPYGQLYVLDEIYPLTYEGGDVPNPVPVEKECVVSDYYCRKSLFLSHMWHASEMFLFLFEQ